MTGRRPKRPIWENSRAAYLSERRTPSDVESSMTNITKRRLVRESETLTRSYKPSKSSRTSNRFEAFHSSARPRRKKRRGKSSSDFFSRQWVSSSQYYSNYKGKDNVKPCLENWNWKNKCLNSLSSEFVKKILGFFFFLLLTRLTIM